VYSNKHTLRLSIALILGVLFAWSLWKEEEKEFPEVATFMPAEQFGYVADPVGAAKFLESLDVRFFADAAPDAMKKAEKVDTFLYRQMNAAHKARYGSKFTPGRQLNGSCVAWGAMHAVYCAESVEWSLGNRDEPPYLPATCSIYGGSRVESKLKEDYDGSRPVGGWSDGSTGYRAARWLRDWGVIYRTTYSNEGDTLDLTTYDKDREKNWGAFGNGGEDDAFGLWLDREAAKTPCKHVANIRTWDELVAAITSGFPVTIASNQGFTRTRDSDGFCQARGTWMHQMMIAGLRFARNDEERDGALIINSWGNYVDGGKYPDDQPDGTFWAEKKVIEKILAQGDSWAIAEVRFKWRDIQHDQWLGNNDEL